jgi:peptidoglycan hydrolase CwlO-like protein
MTSIVSGIFLFAILATATGLSAYGQSVQDAEREAIEAERALQMATGLVDEAVANRIEIENQIADSISRLNDLAASMSMVAAGLDRLEGQLGFADMELAGIQQQIEVQAIDAYMTVLASPTLTLMGSTTVEQALVVSTVVEDVVTAGRESVNDLFIRRRSIEEVRRLYLERQDEFQAAKAEVDAELEHLADLYAQADAAVAAAVRESLIAEDQYWLAVSAVDLARLKEEERRRQEERPTTTTTNPSQNTTTTRPTTTTTSPSATTTSPGPTTTTTPTVFPPHIEQWRPLVSTYFPSHRVDEALKILRCESNGDPGALNPYSGAAGLFQFLRGTWNGLPASVSGGTYESGQVFDPVANTRSAAWLANRYEELGHYYWQAWSCRRVL